MSEIETQRALACATPTPESLEKIFLRIEEESARRAEAELLTIPNPNASEDALRSSSDITPVSTLKSAASSQTSRGSKARRRTSISITRFGELDSEFSLNSQPTTPTAKSGLASPVYQAYRKNGSADTLNLSDNDEDEHAHREDDDHVTQVQKIAARQSVISRSIGTLPRRLSRARSTQLLAGGDASNSMVIGVSVQAATVQTVVNNESDDVRLGAVVHAPGSLRNQTSQPSMKSLGVSGGGGGWIARAKSLTNKLRGKKVDGT